MKPMVYARPSAYILFGHIAKFHRDFVKFETFEIQEFNDMTLPSSNKVPLYDCLRFTLQIDPQLSPAEIPNCHNIHQLRVAIDGPSFDAPRKRESQ
jgi:hypothetical protein